MRVMARKSEALAMYCRTKFPLELKHCSDRSESAQNERFEKLSPNRLQNSPRVYDFLTQP